MSFGYYSPFTIQTGQVPSTQPNFPVPLKPTDARFKTTAFGGHGTDNNGFGFRPYADAGAATPLDFEIVPGTYNPATGTFEMWVRVPSAADGYVIYLFYGDPAINTNGSSTSTWDSNFKGVWHFPDGASLSLADSTSNGGNGTGVSSPTAAAGKIDGGLSTDGTSYVTVPDQTYWDPSGDFTISLWFNYNSLSGQWWDHPFIAHSEGGGSVNKWYFSHDNGNTFVWHINAGGPNIQINSGPNTLSSGTWYHAGITRSGINYLFYLNGAQIGFGSSSMAFPNVNAALFFANGEASAGNRYNGYEDEIRFSDGIARSTDWFTAEYNTGAPSTFTALGAEVQAATGVGARFIRSNGGIWVFNTGGAAGGGLIGDSGGGF